MIEYIIKQLQKIDQTGYNSLLNVGARDVNPGMLSVRDILKDIPEYVGIDLFEGKDVTKVMNAHDIKNVFKKDSFDLVVCTEMLEHDDKFWETVENMRWVTKPGGMMFIAVPGGGAPFHEWPSDYWRFMRPGVEKFFEGWDDVHIESWDIETVYKDILGSVQIHGAIMGWGKKPRI